jgi:deazaflavin-dependent oxidoreductase (nitroreductase family)
VPASLGPTAMVHRLGLASPSGLLLLDRRTQPPVASPVPALGYHDGPSQGQPRSVILAYLDNGPNLVEIAMNGWDPAEPGWWLNLQGLPHATVQLTDQTRPVAARAASGPERARLWELWRSVDCNLDAYARRRPGQTAVVVLQPAEAGPVHPPRLTHRWLSLSPFSLARTGPGCYLPRPCQWRCMP